MSQNTHLTLRQMKSNLAHASPRSKLRFNQLALKHNQRNVVVNRSAIGGGWDPDEDDLPEEWPNDGDYQEARTGRRQNKGRGCTIS